MKEVRVSLDSIDQLINVIAAEESGFADKCRIVCQRLAELGVSVAQTVYTAADYTGVNDASVTLEVEPDGAAIVASGKIVAFLEFGTGVTYPLGEYADQVGAPPHGSYGKGHGKQKTWAYYGEPGTLGFTNSEVDTGLWFTHGNPPANAFPQAVEAMRESFNQIASEVFANGS